MNEPMHSPALAGALDMAARGLAVFPLRPNSKKPFRNGGVAVATTDPSTIREWFTRKPDINYGVATTGALVLDADEKDGRRGLQELEQLGALPDTLRVRTPSQGLHVYFVGADVGQQPLTPGIDVRSHNGYVVGPGSTIDGKVYAVESDARELAFAPLCILERVAAARERTHDTATPLAELDTAAAIERAVAWLQNDAVPAVEGNGGDSRTFQTACTVKDFGISEGMCLELMLEHYNPLCVPEWDAEQLERKVASAYRNGQLPPGAANPAAEFDSFDPSEFSEPEVHAEPLFAPFPLDFDVAELEQRPWLADKVLLRGHVTCIVAPGGAGKSSYTLSLALGAALNNGALIGTAFRDGPHNVLIVNNEDDVDEQKRRIAAMAIAHGIDVKQALGRLHYYTAPGAQPFLAMALDPKQRRLRVTRMLKAVREYCLTNKITVIIFDPFAELHEADENNNNEVAQVAKTFRALARELAAGVVLVHHTRKAPAATGYDGMAGNADVGRGAGALVANTRLSFTLFPMTVREAGQFGVPEKQRRYHVRLDRAKGNYVPPGEASTWFRLETVPLPNGEDAHAMRIIELSEGLEEVRRLYHSALCPLVVAEPGSGMRVKDAARALLSDPVLNPDGLGVDELATKIAAMFSRPCEHEGQCLVCERESPRGQHVLRLASGG